MLTGLSAEIVQLIERKSFGMKLAELQECLHKPPQQIEHAVSQLKRQGLIEQKTPGHWTRTASAHGRTEREPQHTRIVETGVVDRRPAYADPAPDAAAQFQPSGEFGSGTVGPVITQEEPMSKSKTCTKCGLKKGPTGFPKGEDECRLCKKGKAPKSEAGGQKQLRQIVSKVTARKGGAISSAIDEIRVRRESVANDLANLDSLISGLEQLA